MLKSGDEKVSRPTLLSILPQFKRTSKDESQEMFDLLVRALTDPEVPVRLSAGTALVFFGDSAAIPFLETAVVAERDEELRLVLQRDVQALKKKAAGTTSN